ncbi:MAG: MFS transporter [Pseudomonadota bacterium]|nr:MFS transporter [Pseudomonadota bacterium]
MSISWRSPFLVIAAGCLIAMIGFGTRSIFGFFLEPMTDANNWSREAYSLAMAIQNLLWGLTVPIAGAIADKYGPMRVLMVGSVLYALGIFGMAGSQGVMSLYLFGGLLVGIGVAFTSFSIAMAAIARVVSPERRSLALGLGTAASSGGQMVFSPLALHWIYSHGWHDALYVHAFVVLLVLPIAFILPSDTQAKGEVQSDQSLKEALYEAKRHYGFVLLTIGFFVCGFQLGFITIHLPPYVSDLGLDPEVAVVGLALIGGFNIVGSLLSGLAGQRWSKKKSLSFIYLTRGLLILGLLLLPKTELTLYVFSASMGLLWLSTVPLTSGIIAQVFGLRYMATLFGIVFLSHQLGSFLGIWLGGLLFDGTGSYDVVWWLGAALGLAAALVHWPIDENPLQRVRAIKVGN